MRNIRIILAVTALALSAGANAGNLFTCKLPGGKVAKISVDGNKPTYIFGKADATPDVQLDSSKEWYMANNHYAGANYQVTFRVANGNYNYVLYSQNYGNGLDEGLVAYKGSKILYNKKCTEATNVDATVPFSAQPVDFGMQAETDQTSDFIGKLDKNDNIPALDGDDSQQQDTVAQSAPPADGSAPIKINIHNDEFNNTRLNVISSVDLVTVTGAVVNRGNCKVNPGLTSTGGYGFKETPKNRPIKFGQSTEYVIPAGCNVMEVTVNTNMGDWTYQFSQ